MLFYSEYEFSVFLYCSVYFLWLRDIQLRAYTLFNQLILVSFLKKKMWCRQTSCFVQTSVWKTWNIQFTIIWKKLKPDNVWHSNYLVMLNQALFQIFIWCYCDMRKHLYSVTNNHCIDVSFFMLHTFSSGSAELTEVQLCLSLSHTHTTTTATTT